MAGASHVADAGVAIVCDQSVPVEGRARAECWTGTEGLRVEVLLRSTVKMANPRLHRAGSNSIAGIEAWAKLSRRHSIHVLKGADAKGCTRCPCTCKPACRRCDECQCIARLRDGDSGDVPSAKRFARKALHAGDYTQASADTKQAASAVGGM